MAESQGRREGGREREREREIKTPPSLTLKCKAIVLHSFSLKNTCSSILQNNFSCTLNCKAIVLHTLILIKEHVLFHLTEQFLLHPHLQSHCTTLMLALNSRHINTTHPHFHLHLHPTPSPATHPLIQRQTHKDTL